MRGFKFLTNENNEKVYENAQLPVYGSLKAAGADFFCAEDVTIKSIWRNSLMQNEYCLSSGIAVPEDVCKSFKPTMVHTGVCSFMEDDEVLELYSRSSNPKRGLVLANSVGVVDADYEGEIMLAFYNFMPNDVTIKAGERIGQGVFKKFLRPNVNCIVNSESERGAGGFGSTGV